MRGRSHRLPSSEPPDDWGDGSWTVDCVCGVNFDDGEEMVNCDECGVWVHTRCSRFVKGETSFACDKCKNKKNRNDNEETEVARLLVELPTKTMRMDNPFPSTVPPRPPIRLWTDRPIEERVHVHGIPGGDPTLFQGLSSIFTRQLWSCTGYVPKKFNFQYREFPCWDEQNEIDAKPLKIETPLDNGVDALVSLSKEAVSVSPVDMLVGLRGSAEGAGCCERKSSPKGTKKVEGKDSSFVSMQNSAKREKIHSRPIGGHLGKRKKEDMGVGKNQIVKKKSKGSDREADSKKRAATPANEAQKLEFNEDGGFKVVEADSHNIMNDVKRENILPDPESDGYHESCKVNLPAKAHHTEGSFKEVSKQARPVETLIKSEKLDNEVLCRTGCNPESGPVAPSLVETKDVICVPNKEEDFNTTSSEKHDLGDMNGGSSTVAVDSCKLKHPVGDLRCAAPGVQDSCLLYNQNSGVSWSLAKLKIEKIGTASEQPKGDANLPACSHGGINLDNTKHLNNPHEISAAAQPYENLHETNMVTCPSGEHKDDGVDCDPAAVDHCNRDDTVEGIISGEPCQNDQGKGSTTALLARKSSSDPKIEQRNAEESSKAGGINHGSPAPVGHGKVVVGIGKSSSTSSSQIIPKSSCSGSCKPPARPASPNTVRSINSSKQRVKVNSYADIKKNNAVIDGSDARHETARRAAKEQLKGSQSSRLKASKTSKASHASTPKCSLSDSKDQVLHPSSKPSATHVVDSSGSGDTASSLLTQTVQHMPSKTTSSGFSQKGERSSQLSSQQTSKVNHSSSVHSAAPVNSSLTLSDEELALLLHQELNSSPRVPRVPRVRQAGSMPQLASAAATSMLIKRTTGSGGKDHSSVSRRKSKDDLLKDGIRNSCEHTDATKKSDRTLVSSDQQNQDPVSDGSNRKETFNGSSEVSHLSQKNMCSTSTAIASSSSAEAIDQNISSLHNSTKDISDADDDDDVSYAIAAPMPRTLPGLINEIMSSGKNMSCEELCDAVLPHWDNLRKVNGERYAYSSHSQAVLDCLRNRNEWAQLVDRGPKTNAGRKRRKLEADPPVIESEENDHKEGGTSHELEGKNVESHQEEFPKGKRKARKRRRLALQGRGINDVRKRQSTDASIEDDVGPFSHSSEEGTEGIFSEDEIQGTRKRTVGSESSSSSDEAGSL